jgi:hypothetical protein
LITLSTTADNFDRRRKDGSYCELLEVVGVLLQLRLTEQNLRSADEKTRWSIQRTLASKKYGAKPGMRSIAATQD